MPFVQMKHDKLLSKPDPVSLWRRAARWLFAHGGGRSLRDAASQELGGDSRNATTGQPQPLPLLLARSPSAPRSGSVRGRVLHYVFWSCKVQLFLGEVVSH